LLAARNASARIRLEVEMSALSMAVFAADEPVSATLSIFDWSVVAFYMVGLVLLGILVSRRPKAPVDYFLASRATRWPAIGLALFASNMSSTALVGLAGGAYSIGLSVYNYEWSANLILVFFCMFLLPYIIRSKSFTMPEFLERRYDRRARLYFALLTLLLNIFVDSAAILYSGSLVGQVLLPSWPLWLIVAILAGAAGLYTVLGGLRAVIYTESVQAIVLLTGALLISVGAFRRAGGWHSVMSSVDPALISLIRPAHDAGVPWPGLLFGIPLLGFYYWCTNQSIVQRMLSARNIDHARWGALFAGLLKLPILFLIVLPGTCALLLFPHLARPDMVYPNLILRVLPAGLIGLVVSGFVAATMVSISSMLNSASTLITMDVVKQFRPLLSDVQVVRIGKLCTAALFVVAIVWAPQLQLFPSLWQYLQAVLSYAVPPIVAVFLAGMFWRGANADGAAATMRWGSCAGFAFFMINAVFGWTHLHFLYVAPILTTFDIVVLVAVSTAREVEISVSSAATMWTIDFSRVENMRLRNTPAWQDYRIQSAVLLLLTGIIVYLFK
jgi:solute:Na+ symporter, SSS family